MMLGARRSSSAIMHDRRRASGLACPQRRPPLGARRFHRFLGFLTAQETVLQLIALNRRTILDRARSGKRSKTVKNRRKTVKDDGHTLRSQNDLLDAVIILHTAGPTHPPT